jgi:hypothetical protein
MTAVRLLVERRKQARFQVKNPAFVFDAMNVGRIVDISVDGLAFTYDGKETWPRQLTELDLLIDRKTFLNRMPVRVVSDFIISEEPRYRLITRQCGVQFGRLTPGQLQQLENFIGIIKEERPFPLLRTSFANLGYD